MSSSKLLLACLWLLSSFCASAVLASEAGGGVRLASWRWDEYASILLFTLMIVLAGVLKITFHHSPFLSRHLPESCVLILVGFSVGVIAYYVVDEHAQYFPTFTSDLFFNVLLPPIILDASYSLYDRDFLANLGSVVLYAVVGTLFNVFSIGYLLYGLAYAGAMGPFDNAPPDAIRCLIFSSLISAVDPVAVLAIFEEIGVNMSLYFLVFGESLLNDGVTVVLYNTMVVLAGQEHVEYTQYILAFFSFFTVVFGGLTVGVVVGALTAFILKFTKGTRVIEPLIVFAMSYLAFILAETIHWSGIISLIGCGIMQKRYAFPNVSKKTYTTVKYSVKTLASFSDCIIFLFLGIVTVSHQQEWHTGFVLWTLLLCFVIRFIGVFGLTAIINQRRIKPVSYREQFIMAYGGLRGAVGFSLVTILPESEPYKKIFLTTTLVMIFFTVFVQGGTIKLLVSMLKISRKQDGTKKLISTDVNVKTVDHAMAGVEAITGKHSRHTFYERIRRFDAKYTKKWLIREDAEDLMALRMQRITLDDHFARLYGPTVLAHETTKERQVGGGELSEEDAQRLRLALARTPFAAYRNKAYSRDSAEHVRDELNKEQESKWKRIERSLRGRGRSEDEDDHMHYANAAATSAGAAAAGENSTMLLWHKKNLNAADIVKKYREAKGEFKQMDAGQSKVAEDGGDGHEQESKV